MRSPRDHIATLTRRLAFLDEKIAAGDFGSDAAPFVRRERSALRWALGELAERFPVATAAAERHRERRAERDEDAEPPARNTYLTWDTPGRGWDQPRSTNNEEH